MSVVFDYSSRRGAIVPLLPQVHAILKENAVKDKLWALEPPVNFVNWRQRMGQELLDINKRFLFAMKIEGTAKRDVIGFLFYHYGAEANTIYLDELQIAWGERKNPAVLAGIITKLEADPRAKEAQFYGSGRIKPMTDKAMLASVGFKESLPDGREPLGDFKTAMNALKLRYAYGQAAL